jgi:hypothetical protein
MTFTQLLRPQESLSQIYIKDVIHTNVDYLKNYYLQVIQD